MYSFSSVYGCWWTCDAINVCFECKCDYFYRLSHLLTCFVQNNWLLHRKLLAIRFISSHNHTLGFEYGFNEIFIFPIFTIKYTHFYTAIQWHTCGRAHKYNWTFCSYLEFINKHTDVFTRLHSAVFILIIICSVVCLFLYFFVLYRKRTNGHGSYKLDKTLHIWNNSMLLNLFRGSSGFTVQIEWHLNIIRTFSQF